MTCQMMMSLGVYLLGAADAAERQRVEAHLPGCPACQAELARLAPLPGLLAGVPRDMLAAGRPGTTPPVPVRNRRRRDRRWRPPALAACLAAVAGAAAGFWLAPAGVAHRPAPATVTLSAANPALHVSATAALTATSWGTSIQLRLRGAPLNVPCRLIVRSRAGATEVSGVWAAWSDGPISVPASADWLPSDIASLQVTTPARTLLIIKNGRRSS